MDVITIGTVTRDVFLTSKDFKVLKDPEHLTKLGFKTGEAECFALGAKLEVSEPIYAVGGGAANAAVTFSRFGLKTGAFFKVGVDDVGDVVLKELKMENIKLMGVRDKRLRTAYSTILLTPGGERTVLVYRGASGDLKQGEVPFAKLKAKWVYISPGSIPVSLMKIIVDRLSRAGVRLAMNPSSHYIKLGQKLAPILKKLDVVIVNREEGARLTGADYKNEKGIFRKFDNWVPGIAVITEGPDGALVSDGRYMYRSGVFKEKKLLDRLGAGDAFGSAFVAGLIEKNDVPHALRAASANATSVVESVGAHTGVLRKEDLNKSRWKYLDLDVEPL